jgi:hypothetical protein
MTVYENCIYYKAPGHEKVDNVMYKGEAQKTWKCSLGIPDREILIGECPEGCKHYTKRE